VSAKEHEGVSPQQDIMFSLSWTSQGQRNISNNTFVLPLSLEANRKQLSLVKKNAGNEL
jgi:hypothetical protein